MNRSADFIDSPASSVLRSFLIDGVETTDTTYRTRIVESITEIAGMRFIDVGAADGYEARAVAHRGASLALAVEGKDSLFAQAAEAAKISGLKNHSVMQGDIRRIDEYHLEEFDCALCFGVLYHMSNPFNLLKRLARVTNGLLLLETHVAPEPWAESLLLPKHSGSLLHGTRTLFLDGERFEGRVCLHRGMHVASKGSLDEEWTFWLTQASLIKALTCAGFSIEAWYHELDAATPPEILRYGGELGFGHANTKVFVVARLADRKPGPVAVGTVSLSAVRQVRPNFREQLVDRLAVLKGRGLRWLSARSTA